MKVEYRTSNINRVTKPGARDVTCRVPRRHGSFVSYQSSHGAFTLIECLIYIAMFMVITALAYGALHHTWLAHKAIRREADDIALALHAGERWRADIRGATASIQPLHEKNGLALVIPGAEGSTTYRFANGRVTRETPQHPVPVVVLGNVKSSAMKVDIRPSVTAWRWELELRTKRRNPRIPPLFTFTAVPTGTHSPK